MENLRFIEHVDTEPVSALAPIITQLNILPCAGELGVNCVGRIETAIFQFAEALGFRFVRFGLRQSFQPFDTDTIPGLYVSNFPNAWDEAYVAEEHYLHDPVVQYSLDTSKPNYMHYGTWQDACNKATEQLRDNHHDAKLQLEKIDEMFAAAREFDVTEGLFMTHSFGSYDANISLATPVDGGIIDDVFWQQLKAALVLFHGMAIPTLSCASCARGVVLESLGRVRLSDDQVEILTLFFQNRGASIKTIAKIRGCTVDTVNYHLRQIRNIFSIKGSGAVLAQYARDNQYF